MATNTKTTETRPQSAAPKKRRRKRGVPTLLVIILLIIAILIGGLLGFAIARNTDTSRAQLQEANARIMELENTLTLIGFSTDTDNVDEFIFDDTGESDGLADLSGGDTGDDSGAFWSDDTLLDGTLTEPSEPVVVAEFDGGTLTSDEVIPEYNDQLTTQIFAGYSADEIADTLLQQVMSYLVSDKIIATMAQEQGLDQLTDEDRAEIDAEANEIYNDQLDYYTAFVDAQDGMTDEEIRAAAAELMESEEGSTLESITQELEETWWMQKFYDETVKDVTVTDEEVQAHYDEILADQRETFTAYPEEFEYAHINGDTVLYNLDGYRGVRHILIPFSSIDDEAAATDLLDQIAQLDPETDSETILQYQSQLDALYAPLETTAQEILDRLQAGESFETLMDEYGGDDAMDDEPLHSEGYYVSSNTLLWSDEFVEGCMMLEQVGDVSTPVRSSSGIHIIEYTMNVTPGEVSLEDAYDAIRQETLELKQSDYYEEQRQAWLEAANVTYYPERLQ